MFLKSVAQPSKAQVLFQIRETIRTWMADSEARQNKPRISNSRLFETKCRFGSKPKTKLPSTPQFQIADPAIPLTLPPSFSPFLNGPLTSPQPPLLALFSLTFASLPSKAPILNLEVYNTWFGHSSPRIHTVNGLAFVFYSS